MGRHPGPFMLALDGQSGASSPRSCDEVVRAIPAKRLVCRGGWQGQAVYIKVYMGPDKYWQAECRGLQALHEQGIAAPAVLHAGTADHGALHIIVLAAIEAAQTLASAWEQADGEVLRIKLLRLALSTIAAHHLAGLEQGDIHLNNFLLSAEQFYTLDGGGIRTLGDSELSFRHSRDNLARFFAQFYPRFDDLIARVLPDYVSQRGWPAGRLTSAALLQRVRYFRSRRQRHFLKKIFRECSAFVCNKGWRSLRVYDRALETPGLLTLLAIPLGLLIGYGLCAYLAFRFDSDLYRIPLVLGMNVYAFAAMVVIVSAIISAIMIWRNLAHLDMVAVLKSKE